MKFIVLAVISIILCFVINKWLGIAALACAIIYAVYTLIPSIYANRGNVEFSQGNDEEALKWYKKAVDTKHANVIIRASYAFLLLKTGHPEDAETVLNLILMSKNLPANKRNIAKQHRCMVYYKLGRLDEAIEEAEELFENYKNSAVYGMLGYFKILNGDDLNETLNFCLEAYDFNSDDRDILDNLSIVYYKLGQYDKAKEISDKLIKTAPKFIEAFYHGAQIREKCGDTEGALELLENIEDCQRSYLTTVSEEEIESLKKILQNSKNV